MGKVKAQAEVVKQDFALMFKNLNEFLEATCLTVVVLFAGYKAWSRAEWYFNLVLFAVVFVGLRAGQLWIRELRKK